MLWLSFLYNAYCFMVITTLNNKFDSHISKWLLSMLDSFVFWAHGDVLFCFRYFQCTWALSGSNTVLWNHLMTRIIMSHTVFPPTNFYYCLKVVDILFFHPFSFNLIFWFWLLVLLWLPNVTLSIDLILMNLGR